jgi:hypothetical protein
MGYNTGDMCSTHYVLFSDLRDLRENVRALVCVIYIVRM